MLVIGSIVSFVTEKTVFLDEQQQARESPEELLSDCLRAQAVGPSRLQSSTILIPLLALPMSESRFHSG